MKDLMKYKGKVDKISSNDDLIYRYKGETPGENFNDNALDLIDRIKKIAE